MSFVQVARDPIAEWRERAAAAAEAVEPDVEGMAADVAHSSVQPTRTYAHSLEHPGAPSGEEMRARWARYVGAHLACRHCRLCWVVSLYGVRHASRP